MKELEMLAAIARDAELPSVADEAASLAERLSAGRFFVACVGQFKRGKSTVLNALVGDPVLPTGVTPVTSVVTILRYGAERRGTVFYTAGPNEEIPVEDVPLYVTGEHNHENVKGVAVVEVFLPAPLLARGLCLVDTPGIGSTFAANSEVTRAFVPHIDAALVVLGADPPISGDELALVLDVLRQVPNAIFVLNKADRLSSQDMRQAREFTERLIGEHLGRPVASPLEISALERIQSGATRDWDRLHDALVALNTDAAEILRHTRGGATDQAVAGRPRRTPRRPRQADSRVGGANRPPPAIGGRRRADAARARHPAGGRATPAVARIPGCLRERRQAGHEAVATELARIDTLRQRLDRVTAQS
ncbi:MAG: hypothetical protein DMF98_03450 [Acidobacteria bacterium]|nr:MAG: hypothetical protein DMF98_03450 [Acidobacteriota bacterium]